MVIIYFVRVKIEKLVDHFCTIKRCECRQVHILTPVSLLRGVAFTDTKENAAAKNQVKKI